MSGIDCGRLTMCLLCNRRSVCHLTLLLPTDMPLVRVLSRLWLLQVEERLGGLGLERQKLGEAAGDALSCR